jgi:murein DD-endopeptidase MepM/ murein hydrolase activator NlpD
VCSGCGGVDKAGSADVSAGLQIWTRWPFEVFDSQVFDDRQYARVRPVLTVDGPRTARLANLRYAQSGHKHRVDAHRRSTDARMMGARGKTRLLLAAVALPAGLSMLLATAHRAFDAKTAPAVARASAGVSAASVETVDGVEPLEVARLPQSVDAAPMTLAVVQDAQVAPPPAPPPGPPPPTTTTVEDRLQQNEALSTALSRHGASADEVSGIVRAIKGVLDVRGLRAGAKFLLEKKTVGESQQLASFTFQTTAPTGVPRLVRATRVAVETIDDQAHGSASFAVEVEDAVIETVVAGVQGSIRSSLYDAVLESGGDPNLVNRFVDVFAWNIDFYKSSQRGDQFRVLVEKKVAGGRFVGWGKVLAAEYVNAGTAFRGFNFETKDGKFSGFFDDEGQALERTFLKNPMEVARITSSYGMRFHPVLGHNKQHEGIDYGAPTGTPVWSVADGTVVEARYSATAGKMIVVKHINGYTTEYFHLSKFAEGLKAGSRVRQKQVIGYVGTTGRSTGPHLHFGMRKTGASIDPGKQKFPNAKPIPKQYQREFEQLVGPLAAELKALDRA